MKIIKEAKISSKWKNYKYETKQEEINNRRYVAKCYNCKCMVEYKWSDLKDHFVGLSDPYLERYITCPSCKDTIVHSMFNRRPRKK